MRERSKSTYNPDAALVEPKNLILKKDTGIYNKRDSETMGSVSKIPTQKKTSEKYQTPIGQRQLVLDGFDDRALRN